MIARLHPDDVEAIARRVADLLQTEASVAAQNASLLSPAGVADRIGRSTEWVREHAVQLGVIRLGEGPRPRLWFRPDVVDERVRELAQCSGCTPEQPPARRDARRRHPSPTPGTVDLLEIRGRAA